MDTGAQNGIPHSAGWSVLDPTENSSGQNLRSEIRISPHWGAVVLLGVGVMLFAVSQHMSGLPDRLVGQDLALLLVAVSTVVWLLALWKPLTGRWAVLAALLLIATLSSRWLRTPSPLTLLILPVPLMRPPLITLGILMFLGHWNNFLGPFIYLRKYELFTAAVGLQFFRTVVAAGGAAEKPREHLLMAGSTVMTAPALILFMLAQRYFVRSVIMSGLKM
jgi:hypothetical protein